MRGLKPRPGMDCHQQNQSHLLQMRGLKLLEGKSLDTVFGYVASFTDAWIETSDEPVISGLSVSHLLQMRGLKLKLAS